jgi:hypothetical protein
MTSQVSSGDRVLSVFPPNFPEYFPPATIRVPSSSQIEESHQDILRRVGTQESGQHRGRAAGFGPELQSGGRSGRGTRATHPPHALYRCEEAVQHRKGYPKILPTNIAPKPSYWACHASVWESRVA